MLSPLSSDTDDSPLQRDWGRVVAQFIRDQWACVSILQRAGGFLRPPEAPGFPVALQAAVEALSLLPSNLVLPVLDFMASVLPQVGSIGSPLCQALMSWFHILYMVQPSPELNAFLNVEFH